MTCRIVRLLISDGVATDGWELAEFELYGDLTPDADNDSLTDSWEVQYFGDLAHTTTNDNDADGLDDAGEQRENTNPTIADTDYDGMNDGMRSSRELRRRTAARCSLSATCRLTARSRQPSRECGLRNRVVAGE